MSILKYKNPVTGQWEKVGIPGVDITPKEIGAVATVSATIPRGRMKGDVDGDGVITQADVNAINKHANNIQEITDEIALWCADVTNDGAITSSDASQITRFISGKGSAIANTPTMADYYGNWTYFKVDSVSGYFYTDIPVTGMAATSDALVIVSGEHPADEFSAECVSGAVRITAQFCPIAAIPCQIMWSAEGSGVVAVVPEKTESSVSAMIPKGRMRGDVDGDGSITMSDYDLIYNHVQKVEFITDEIALWCADVNLNGDANLADYAAVMKYIMGETSILTSTPTFADYYNNWTYSRIDDLTGKWTADIPVTGMTPTSDALIIMSGEHTADEFSAECIRGAVRITVTTPPITEIPCRIVRSAAGSGIVMIRPEKETPATASAEIAEHNAATDAHADIRAAISDHAESKSNPHGVTAKQVGANSEAFVDFDETVYTTVESWIKANFSASHNRPFTATYWEGYNTTDAPFTFWGMMYAWGWNDGSGIIVRIQPNNDGGAYERMYRNGAWLGDWNRIIHTGNKNIITPADIGAATTATYSTTVTTSWTADGDYFYQDIAVSGILATDTPIVDINPGSDNAANALYSESVCKVFRITTSANSIRVWATEAVATAFPIQLKVVR